MAIIKDMEISPSDVAGCRGCKIIMVKGLLRGVVNHKQEVKKGSYIVHYKHFYCHQCAENLLKEELNFINSCLKLIKKWRNSPMGKEAIEKQKARETMNKL